MELLRYSALCLIALAAPGCYEQQEKLHGNGAVRERASVRIKQSGLYERHGPYESYYPDRQIESRGFYVMGQKHGAWTTWYPNGQKRSEGTYRPHDEIGHYVDGQWRRWTDVESRDGPWIEWHENGRKKREGTYERGKEVGAWTEWDADGGVVAGA